MRTTKFIKEIVVIDPDTRVEVHVEIHKDSESGGIFGVDASYLDQLSSVVNSPFNGTCLECGSICPDCLTQRKRNKKSTN